MNWIHGFFGGQKYAPASPVIRDRRGFANIALV